MLTWALLLGLLTTVANIAGSLMVALPRRPSRTFLTYAVGFGGGFLVATTLTEILPEALEGGLEGALWVALGYLLVFLGEHLFGAHYHRIPEGEGHPHGPPPLLPSTVGIATLVAFNLHDFLDGMAIGAGFTVGTGLGVMAFLAVMAHEVPAGFTISAVMRGAGYSRLWALMAGVAIGLITLVGIAVPFLAGGAREAPLFLGLAGGSFLYVGASLLVPATETGPSRWGFLSVVAGMGLSLLAGLMVGA